MQQVRTVWAGLNKGQKITVAGAVVAMFLAILTMTRIASAPSMVLLYAGLENATAGEVVRALDQRNIPYEVRGGSIYVPDARRDELRMTLASEGLPANGGKGYELLDALSGFGTTSQMFDAAYWRAKEGELARTIIASPYASQARVHIANGAANPFQREIQPTASVSVMSASAQLTAAQAKAIRFLVASAVSGLSVDNVTVIDADGTIIGALEDTSATSVSDDRARQLRERVLRLVEARVGTGNAVVEVSVDTVTETESIRERRFDPNGRVAISTDVEERSDNSRNQSAGVTVASNLPDGDGAEGDETNSTASQSRERVNYEVSETELEILRVPGAIKRLTVAVLVNGTKTADASGALKFEPLPQAELDALKELVASAVGFDTERGDVITLKSLDMPAVEPIGTLAESTLWQRLNFDVMSLIQLATLAVVTLFVGLFVVRPIFSKQVAASPLLTPPERNAGNRVLTGEIETDIDPATALPGAPEQNQAVAVIGGQRPDEAVERLRAMIGDKQEETVEILRNWLEENEEVA